MNSPIKNVCDSVAALPLFKADANTAAFARHLVLATFQELLRQEYPATKFASGELLPISTSINEGAREYSYFELGSAGKAGIVADNATDIPSATLTGDLTVRKVHTVACSFEYSTQDVRSAQMQGLYDMASEKALACREGHDRAINDLIRTGQPGIGLNGFTNHPGIIVQAAGTGNWLAATAAQIVADFSTAAGFLRNDSQGVEDPNTAIFPVDIWTRISTLQNSAASDVTVLDYLRRAWPEISLWTYEPGLSTVGAGSTPAVMIYDRNPSKARAVMPMVMRPLAPEQHGLCFKVVMESRFGGVMAPRPRSILRLEGV